MKLFRIMEDGNGLYFVEKLKVTGKGVQYYVSYSDGLKTIESAREVIAQYERSDDRREVE